MKVLVFAPGQDTGGQGERIRQAFARHVPDVHVDAIAMTRKYMAYPEQFTGRAFDRGRIARALYDAADVVHLRLSPAPWEKYDRGQHKPVVLHHHGTIFRASHFALSSRARQIGAVEVASTIDLTMLEPGVTWLPSPFDLGALRAIRERVYEPGEAVRIAHAPTSRVVKSTSVFEIAVKHLAREFPIEVDIIENATWQECLERKARADIVYDQLVLGYGNNSVEAWGMGLPVVAGVMDPAVRSRMGAVWGGLPFVEATRDTLEDRLRALVQSRAMREDFGARGAAHAARFHDEAVVARQLRDIYTGAPATVDARPVPVLSGRERRLAMAGAR